MLREVHYSPVGRAMAVEFCGDDYRSQFGDWENGGRVSPPWPWPSATATWPPGRWEDKREGGSSTW